MVVFVWVLRDQPQPVSPSRRVGVPLRALFPASSGLLRRCLLVVFSSQTTCASPWAAFSCGGAVVKECSVQCTMTTFGELRYAMYNLSFNIAQEKSRAVNGLR